MTSGSIAEGLAAGSAASPGNATSHDKLAGSGRPGDASVIVSVGNAGAGQGFPIGIASTRLGVALPTASNAAEWLANWKKEFTDQTGRLAVGIDSSESSGGSGDVIDAAIPAGFSTLKEGSPALHPTVFMTSFPAAGSMPVRGKAEASRSEPAGFFDRPAIANGHALTPSPTLLAPASASGFLVSHDSSAARTTTNSSNSARGSQSSGPQRTQSRHSRSSAPASPPSAQSSDVIALPAPVSMPLAVQTPAGYRALSEMETSGWRVVNGSVTTNAVIPATSVPVMEASAAAIHSATDSHGQPSTQSGVSTNAAASTLSRGVPDPRIVSDAGVVGSSDRIAGNRPFASDLSNAGAKWIAVREVVSSSPGPVDAEFLGQQIPGRQMSLSHEAAPLSSAKGSLTGLSLHGVQPDAHELLQLPGVVTAIVAGTPRGAFVRGTADSQRLPANEATLGTRNSEITLAEAGNPETPAGLGASVNPAVDPEAARAPNEGVLPTNSLGQHPAGDIAASPLPMQGVNGTGDPTSTSFAGGFPEEPAVGLERLGRTARAPATVTPPSSVAIPAKEKLAGSTSSVRGKDSGAAQGATLHASASVSGVSFLYSGPSEAGLAAIEGVGSQIRQESAADFTASSRSPSEISDMFDRMDQAPVQGAGSADAACRDSRVGASSAVPQELQVGYQDSVLGYVELHAHVGVNGVHASLEAQSAAAGDMLTGHLSALAGWMDERHTPVESLTISTLGTQPDSSLAHHGKDSAPGEGGGARSNDSGAGNGSQDESSRPDRGAYWGTGPRIDSRAESSLAAAQPLVLQESAGSFAAPVLPLPVGGGFSVVA